MSQVGPSNQQGNAPRTTLNRFTMSLPIAPPPSTHASSHLAGPRRIPNNQEGASSNSSNLNNKHKSQKEKTPNIPNNTNSSNNPSSNPTGDAINNTKKRKRNRKSNKTTPSSSSSLPPSTSSSTEPTEAKKSVQYTNGFGQIITAKMGKFSSSESQIIQQAVRDYCAQNNVSISRLCSSEIDARSEEFRGVWLQISQKLPHRTTRAVYRHAMRVMHPFKRGDWTEEETRELMLLVIMHGKKWVKIQNKLNRIADSCRDKYRECHMDFKKGEWGEEETRLLEKHVRDVLKLKGDVNMYQVEEMIQRNPEKYRIPWDKVSKLMENRSRLSCFRRYAVLVRAGKHGEELMDDDDESSVEMEHVSYGGKRNRTKSSNLKPVHEATSGTNDVVSKRRNDSDSESTVSSSDRVGSGDDDSENGPSRNRMSSSKATHVVKFNKGSSTGKKRGRQEMSSASNANKVHDVTAGAIRTNPTLTKASKNDSAMDTGDASSYDRQLLRNLATSSYSRNSDVNWNAIRYPLGDAEERWQTLLDEWIETYGIDEDEVMDKPIWEVAKEILNQDVETTEMDQAELAARTVEAVFLI